MPKAPPVAPDQPEPSAPIAPSVTLPTVEKVSGSKIEPPAAAHSGPAITPAQEAAEILASGRFLAPVIAEGGFLTHAAGTLGRDEFFGVWTFELTDRLDGASDRSLILLPAEPLADMIRRHVSTVKDGTSAPSFEISGQVLVFRGRNFLLPTFAVPVDRRIQRPPTPRLFPPGSKGALAAANGSASIPLAAQPMSQPTTEPVAAAVVIPEAKSVDPETFAKDLETRLNERVVTVASSADASAPAVAAPPGTEQPSRAVASASDSSAAMPMIEARTTSQTSLSINSATPLMPPMKLQSRRGTITRDPVTGTWRFIFASGQLDDGDVALELLPCTKLSELIADARSSTTSTSVLLTGDVTVFEWRNYLRPTRSQRLESGKWIGP